MRSYPTNSPQAAARIVALALLADGHVCKSEVDLLDRVAAHDQLGLDRAALHAVVHTFCEDLLGAMHLTWNDACRVDPRTMAELMAEIDDPALRAKLLNICVAVVDADDHIAEGECIVLGAAVEHWGLHRSMFETGRLTAAAT